MKPAVKHVLILFIIGTFVSAQQVSSENVFEAEDVVRLDRLVLESPDFTVGTVPEFRSVCYDTVEVLDVELEEEKGPSLYKELAVYIIVAAMVAYMVIQIIRPGEEEEQSNGKDGKEPPG